MTHFRSIALLHGSIAITPDGANLVCGDTKIAVKTDANRRKKLVDSLLADCCALEGIFCLGWIQYSKKDKSLVLRLLAWSDDVNNFNELCPGQIKIVGEAKWRNNSIEVTIRRNKKDGNPKLYENRNKKLVIKRPYPTEDKRRSGVYEFDCYLENGKLVLHDFKFISALKPVLKRRLR